MKFKLSLSKPNDCRKITFLLLTCLFLNISLFSQGVVELQQNERVAYCQIDPCPCDGNYSEIQVYYFGEDNVSIEVYADADHLILITSFVGVNGGDLLTINGAALVGGTLAYKTYIHTTTAADETCQTKIHTSCPSLGWPGSREDLKILGKTYGDFTVYSRTDGETFMVCDISNVAQDWHVGGNIIGPANNTMGTKNNENVVFITNDDARGTITNTGDFGINTLSPTAQLDVQGDVIVNETLDVNGITTVHDNTASTNASDGALVVTGGAGIGQSLNVGDNARITNDLVVGNDGSVANDLSVGNDAAVGRDGMFGRNLEVGVDATIINDLEVGNDAIVGNDLAVSHNASIVNDATIGRNLDVINDATVGQDLTVANNADVSNSLTVGTNAQVGQNLTVSNSASIGDDLGVSGDAYVNGVVTIGTNNTPNSLGTVNTSLFQLFVDGGILTEEVLVRTGWADYVFEADYVRPSLEEVENHIAEHGHLPNTPSAKEVENNGLNLGDNAVLQQEKIEELFLHLIEMNKNIKDLQAENKALKATLESM